MRCGGKVLSIKTEASTIAEASQQIAKAVEVSKSMVLVTHQLELQKASRSL